MKALYSYRFMGVDPVRSPDPTAGPASLPAAKPLNFPDLWPVTLFSNFHRLALLYGKPIMPHGKAPGGD